MTRVKVGRYKAETRKREARFLPGCHSLCGHQPQDDSVNDHANCLRCRTRVRAVQVKYYQTDKGKATTKRSNDDPRRYTRCRSNPSKWLWHNLAIKIGKTLVRENRDSKTVMSFTDFQGRDDMRAHFENQFDTANGMSWENYGKGEAKWNIGHRIAKAMYDKSSAEDTRRCWTRDNLFPQWETENMALSVKLPDIVGLIQLVPSWPVAWKNTLPRGDRVRELEKRARRGY
jgi:hypothetical protein